MEYGAALRSLEAEAGMAEDNRRSRQCRPRFGSRAHRRVAAWL